MKLIYKFKPLFVVGLLMILSSACSKEKSLPIEKIQLPPGFKISLYAVNIPNARGMALGRNGTVFVGSRAAGNVYAITDNPNDPNSKKVFTIAQDLQLPVGVAFKDGALYVSAVSQILRFDDIENNLANPPEPIIVNDSFPKKKHHGWKFIAFGPDELLYVPVGAPCNNCLSDDPRFASIMRMKPDGKDLEIFAHGVRNTVGFDWHPDTKELWFTDNGRDWLGENSPPDELNHAPRKDMHFGYPFCHGQAISDPEYGKQRNCDGFTPSEVQLGPHVAALGMRFYTGTMFPEQYKGKIFIAEHGSWNRLTPIGYRITLVDPENTQESYEIFAQGWLQGRSAWGRPVDILNLPDGSLLVSDDAAGVIYRITYESNN
jgi:glucose/arabinose dehydrogenase